MLYRAGYKYQLFEPEIFDLGFTLPAPIATPFILVTITGQMRLEMGYAWNGANVVPDFRWLMRGSAGHDAIFQLIRLGLLDFYPWFDRGNRLLQRWCREDGAWQWEADLVYRCVRCFGESSASPDEERPILTAP